jgi:RNA polymerase sigma-70 factor (ECF subfamily)
VASSDPERALLDAAAEGDSVALAQLVRSTQPAVWRLCTFLGSAGNEEDLVQETYLRALRALPTFRGDAPVQTWLLTIARRVCADDVRRRERQRRLTRRLSQERNEVQGPPSTTEELVDQLEADRRDAFVMTQLLGLTYEEAAQALDCPIGTIRSRVARARTDLIEMVRRAEAR